MSASTSTFASSKRTDPPNVTYECANEGRGGPVVGCMVCREDVTLEWCVLGMMVLCAGCPVCDTAVWIEYV